jgi:arylsulfatase A-like enzyme
MKEFLSLLTAALRDRIPRSADFQSAVSPIYNRQDAGTNALGGMADGSRIANPRYSRMQSCATSRGILSCALLALTALTGLAAPKQPNILLIFCDDLTMQAISAYRHPLKLLQTPNMDRLAKEGMLFERCLVPNSICGPSRAVILTGKYSHLNGFYRNGNRFDGAQQTFPKLLQAAGYQTALIGKWHLETDPTGFNHWQILPGQGIYYNPVLIKHGQRETHEGYVTDLITDFSIEWLKTRDRSKPFLLMSQHKAPHREWAPALRHLGWNKDKKFPEPETLFDDYSGRGRAEREQDMTLEKTFTRLDAKLETPRSLNAGQRKAWDAYYAPRNKAYEQANLTGTNLVRWRYQRYMHDYLGTVLAVDESVGRLLKFLDDEGLADNTVVVFSSDQGFYLGEHGWFDKRWIYEESVTTPLIVRWPGVTKAGSRNANLVSVLDFPETFLDAAGVPVPAEMQGRSLAPLLRGQTPKDWRTSFYYHYYEFPAVHSVRKHYGVVTDHYKLFHFYEPDMNSWTLIDNRKDPHELKNVYDDRSYADVRQQLHAELNRLRAELKVPAQDAPESLSPAQSAPTAPPPGKAKKKSASNG